MTDLYISLLVEGPLDEQVLRQMLKRYQRIHVLACFGKQGKQYLYKRIHNYNTAAAHQPFICLVDLDQEECAPGLIQRWLPDGCHPNFLLRVAVPEVESWLIADHENFAAFIGVSKAKLPLYPDQHADLKQVVVNLARQSKIRRVRQNVVPDNNSAIAIGKAYVDELITFTLQKWNIDRARLHSPSLQKALDAFYRLSADK
jgi:hypothetical protein